MVVLVVTFVTGMHLNGPATSPFNHLIGGDLVVSYMAGTFVREGRPELMTDPAAAAAFQNEVRRSVNLPQHGRTGPCLNPPFGALLFVPLSLLPFRAALWTWFGLNLFMLSAAILLLYRMLPQDKRRPIHGAIIAGLLVVSMPCLLAMACQQNTFLSLLILCGAMSLARTGRPFAAGAVAAMLLYKPQLAVIVCGALVCILGRRAILGMIATAAILLLATLVFLPGTMGDYLHKLPTLVPYLRTDRPYFWERQSTFLGFWRLLLGGRTGGPNTPAVTILWFIGAGTIGATLAVPLWRALCANGMHLLLEKWRRAGAMGCGTPLPVDCAAKANATGRRVRQSMAPTSPGLASIGRDRLLAATIAASPLLMPYYMDYDLLLLAVPVVLLAAERMQTGPMVGDRRLFAGWIAIYGWLYFNAAVGDSTGVSVIVPLMAIRIMMPARSWWNAQDPQVEVQKPEADRPVGDTGFQPLRNASHVSDRELPVPQCSSHGLEALEARVTGRAVPSGQTDQQTHWKYVPLPIATAIIAVVLAAAAGVLDRASPLTFGHDLLPGYVAGRLVLEGRAGALYNADATRSIGGAVIADQNLTNDASHVVWLNPPHFAWLFAPLAAMPYRTALLVWLGINAALATGGIATVFRWIQSRRHAFWLGVAALTSCPFLLAVEHQQSTFLSLAILTAVVAAWRSDRPMLAGLLVGLLAYKPQIALATGVVLLVCDGRRALVGLAISGALAAAAGELLAPGSTVAFLTKAPIHAAYFQQHPGYNWGRQVTPTAFLQSLLGAGSQVATFAGHAISLCILIAIGWIARRLRTTGEANSNRDCVIALALCAMPLCAPYFMDYDLLLLAIPAALLLNAGHVKVVAVGGLSLWLLTYVNVGLVAATGVNVVVLLLVGIVGAMSWRTCVEVVQECTFGATANQTANPHVASTAVDQ